MSIRQVIQTHQGHQHGPITRVFSPGDVGEVLKPFVFLDYLDAEISEEFGFGFHPHSGIATLTHVLDADVDYEDTSGQKGIVKAGGIEWMKAGGGVWHKGKPTGAKHAHGFQLWVALPADAESDLAEGCYLPPEKVEQMGQTRVLTGQYDQIRGHVPTPTDMNYFYIDLTQDAHWHFAPPAHHNVAWAYVRAGSVRVGTVDYAKNTLLVFDESHHAIELMGVNNASLVFGSAQRHPHTLHLGRYSVHTSQVALEQGERKIREIYQQLKSENRL